MSMRVILGCIKKADEDFNLIQDGDKIAVGVSGGKDSMVLLQALHLYKKFSKKNYELIGINLIMGFPDMDFTQILNYCEKQEIRFVQYPTKIYKILQLNLTNQEKLPCSLCSKMKKAAVIAAAKEYGCNKVTFAHHGDDAIETLVLNAIYGGRLATFSPIMHLKRADFTFIRPLVYAREKDIRRALKEGNIPFVQSTCPNDKHTQREEVKQMLHDLYRKYPFARKNFLTMLKHDDKTELWEKDRPLDKYENNDEDIE